MRYLKSTLVIVVKSVCKGSRCEKLPYETYLAFELLHRKYKKLSEFRIFESYITLMVINGCQVGMGTWLSKSRLYLLRFCLWIVQIYSNCWVNTYSPVKCCATSNHVTAHSPVMDDTIIVSNNSRTWKFWASHNTIACAIYAVLDAFQARAMSRYFGLLIGNGVAYFRCPVLVTTSVYAVTAFRCHARVRNLFEVIIGA